MSVEQPVNQSSVPDLRPVNAAPDNVRPLRPAHQSGLQAVRQELNELEAEAQYAEAASLRALAVREVLRETFSEVIDHRFIGIREIRNHGSSPPIPPTRQHA